MEFCLFTTSLIEVHLPLISVDSFTKVKDWIANIRDHASHDIPVMLIGNKVDLEKYADCGTCLLLDWALLLAITADFLVIYPSLQPKYSERSIATEEGKKLAGENEIGFEEVSALDSTNIQPMFMNIVRKIVDVKENSKVSIFIICNFIANLTLYLVM